MICRLLPLVLLPAAAHAEEPTPQATEQAQPQATEQAKPQATEQAEALAAAEEWLGVPYRWGGRGTKSHPGMDCLGIMFRAWNDDNSTNCEMKTNGATVEWMRVFCDHQVAKDVQNQPLP